MSKERLEEIKDIVIAMSVAEDRDDDEDYNFIMNEFFDKHFDWMYQQAELGMVQQQQFHDMQKNNLKLNERVQELERKNKLLKGEKGVEIIEKREQQNKFYHETIESIRSYMETGAIAMLSDKERLDSIHEVLKEHYENVRESNEKD